MKNEHKDMEEGVKFKIENLKHEIEIENQIIKDDARDQNKHLEALQRKVYDMADEKLKNIEDTANEAMEHVERLREHLERSIEINKESIQERFSEMAHSTIRSHNSEGDSKKNIKMTNKVSGFSKPQIDQDPYEEESENYSESVQENDENSNDKSERRESPQLQINRK